MRAASKIRRCCRLTCTGAPGARGGLDACTPVDVVRVEGQHTKDAPERIIHTAVTKADRGMGVGMAFAHATARMYAEGRGGATVASGTCLPSCPVSDDEPTGTVRSPASCASGTVGRQGSARAPGPTQDCPGVRTVIPQASATATGASRRPDRARVAESVRFPTPTSMDPSPR